ncbi:hypothetical protein K469DRAFT_600653 [Zopfia rhizophila CBS 207.26]|uniref:diphosphoinositol-polyphosphate diphosphatase n=1 Tax=Zopfia rhizophila CBS 207.26 TaxID=1314779 RepID=A0A6A6DKN1_9PEZI|nr:hypothetical protein K469DRAFT_600653 [Zopfia rhizophila CBS 207.26]
MSITNGGSEEQEAQPQSNILAESVNRLIRALGFTYGELLSQHAHDKPHEDIPSDAVKSPEEAAALATPTITASPLPVPNFESRCPDRLRSLLPPTNFGAVVPGSIYRSSYPQPENFGFLKSLKLKTILTLVPEEVPLENRNFMADNDIQHFQVHIPANKGEVKIQTCQMSKALGIVLDRSNHPILIHCNKGKHRTGCVVGCFRKAQGEEFDSIFGEYHTYADPKARILDECFIELFDDRTVLWMARLHNWVLPNTENVPASPLPSLSVARPRA